MSFPPRRGPWDLWGPGSHMEPACPHPRPGHRSGSLQGPAFCGLSRGSPRLLPLRPRACDRGVCWGTVAVLRAAGTGLWPESSAEQLQRRAGVSGALSSLRSGNQCGRVVPWGRSRQPSQPRACGAATGRPQGLAQSLRLRRQPRAHLAEQTCAAPQPGEGRESGQIPCSRPRAEQMGSRCRQRGGRRSSCEAPQGLPIPFPGHVLQALSIGLGKPCASRRHGLTREQRNLRAVSFGEGSRRAGKEAGRARPRRLTSAGSTTGLAPAGISGCWGQVTASHPPVTFPSFLQAAAGRHLHTCADMHSAHAGVRRWPAHALSGGTRAPHRWWEMARSKDRCSGQAPRPCVQRARAAQHRGRGMGSW